MKFLNFAIPLWFGLGVFAAQGDDGIHDFEKLSTTEGTVYREILVVDADGHGLLFRHRDGIAKLPFASLPTNLRMLYETVEPVEEVPEEAASEGAGDFSLVFTVRTRVYPQAFAASPWAGGCAPVPWKSHWPRYHPVHSLVNPYCRELATRDFLYSAGLLPTPLGVATFPLPRHRLHGHF
ncbi:MAG: hypothetical protein WD342_01005 [Verrucomicrobiales bacterium]